MPLDEILTEFQTTIQRLDLRKNDEEVLCALENVWNEAASRFSLGSVLAAHSKKAQQDASSWMASKLHLTPQQQEDNGSLISFFDNQLCLLFEIQSYLNEISTQSNNQRD